VPYTFALIGDLGQTNNSQATVAHVLADASMGMTLLIGDLSCVAPKTRCIALSMSHFHVGLLYITVCFSSVPPSPDALALFFLFSAIFSCPVAPPLPCTSIMTSPVRQ